MKFGFCFFVASYVFGKGVVVLGKKQIYLKFVANFHSLTKNKGNIFYNFLLTRGTTALTAKDEFMRGD